MISIFNIENTEPALKLQEISYNIEQQPILYSYEFHRSGILEHTLLRKRI